MGIKTDHYNKHVALGTNLQGASDCPRNLRASVRHTDGRRSRGAPGTNREHPRRAHVCTARLQLDARRSRRFGHEHGGGALGRLSVVGSM
jgi:hypothetical protein